MNGILLIDKDDGWTSNDVVCKLKGILHERRVGHSGTLDPMATGLLCVFVGRATRAVSFSENHDKVYIAELKIGIETDTQDITGNIVDQNNRVIDREILYSVLPQFIGEIMQVPPMYSAIKVNGERLYKLARAGKQLELNARPVSVYDIEIIDNPKPNLFSLSIHCSKGTYIRTLCHDIGKALGTCACMASLRRIKVGPMDVSDAINISDIQELKNSGADLEKLLTPVSELFSTYESITINTKQEKQLRNGSAFDIAAPNGKYRVFSATGEFLAVSEIVDSQLKIIKSFYEV